MIKIITPLLLLSLSSSLFALPPEVKLDQYTRGLVKVMNTGNYSKADNYFVKIDKLVKENNFKPLSSYYYSKAKAYSETGEYTKAYENAEKYIDELGPKGKYYSESLEILDKSEQNMENKSSLIWGYRWQSDVSEEPRKLSWNRAKTYCDILELDGFTDWYLPTKNQLVEMHEDNEKLNYIKPRIYWTSSTYESSKDNNWHIGFYDGGVVNYHNSRSCYVRCVRAGK